MKRTLSPTEAGVGPRERRSRHRVRAIFGEACALVAPFFSREYRRGGVVLDHLAYHVLRDRFPELSFEEVHVLVVAAKRVLTTREATHGAD